MGIETILVHNYMRTDGKTGLRRDLGQSHQNHKSFILVYL